MTAAAIADEAASRPSTRPGLSAEEVDRIQVGVAAMPVDGVCAGTHAKADPTAPGPPLARARPRWCQAAIRSATSLEEVARLERILRSGAVPDAPSANGNGVPADGEADMEED